MKFESPLLAFKQEIELCLCDVNRDRVLFWLALVQYTCKNTFKADLSVFQFILSMSTKQRILAYISDSPPPPKKNPVPMPP